MEFLKGKAEKISILISEMQCSKRSGIRGRSRVDHSTHW